MGAACEELLAAARLVRVELEEAEGIKERAKAARRRAKEPGPALAEKSELLRRAGDLETEYGIRLFRIRRKAVEILVAAAAGGEGGA